MTNPNIATYNSMTIEDLQKEYNKEGLLAEDKTAVIHAIARKRSNNTTSLPADAKPLPGKETGSKK